jgi:hypothetical protein
MVFLNSPCRETPKNVLKKKVKKKKVRWWVGGSEISQMYGGVRRFFLAAPRAPALNPRYLALAPVVFNWPLNKRSANELATGFAGTCYLYQRHLRW